MIVLDLCCDSNHGFEGWFASAGAFEAQRAAGRVACPVCNSASIVRRPSAPYVQRGEKSGAPAQPPQAVARLPAASMQAALLNLARSMMRGAENVGEAFPEEARKIHYGEAEERSIRGVASAGEAEALLEEGILVVPLPWPDDDALH